MNARNASETMIRMPAVLALVLTVEGCMMPGMMGMGGAGGMGGDGMSGAEHTAPAPTVIKETVTQGIRITAAFPSFTVGDSVAYTVTVTHVGDASPVNDASLRLTVSADTGVVSMAPSVPSHAHAGARDSSAAGRLGVPPQNVWTPTPSGGGSYVFHPAIPVAGAHRVSVVLDRVGEQQVAPPIELAQVVQLNRRMDRPTNHGSTMGGWGSSTLVYVGAAVMAIMMIVTRR